MQTFLNQIKTMVKVKGYIIRNHDGKFDSMVEITTEDGTKSFNMKEIGTKGLICGSNYPIDEKNVRLAVRWNEAYNNNENPVKYIQDIYCKQGVKVSKYGHVGWKASEYIIYEENGKLYRDSDGSKHEANHELIWSFCRDGRPMSHPIKKASTIRSASVNGYDTTKKNTNRNDNITHGRNNKRS